MSNVKTRKTKRIEAQNTSILYKKKKLKRGPYIRILYIEIMHGVFPNEKA